MISGATEGLQLYQKETPVQVFSCEICEIFKNSYFEELLRKIASVINLEYIQRSSIVKVHHVKIIWKRVFSDLYFPALRLNTKIHRLVIFAVLFTISLFHRQIWETKKILALLRETSHNYLIANVQNIYSFTASFIKWSKQRHETNFL